MESDNRSHALLYLWNLRTLYIGELFELPLIHTAASCFMLGLEKPFRIQDVKTGKVIMTQSALVPANVKVNVYSGGQVMVTCFLDPFGSDLRALRNEMKHFLGAVQTNHYREAQQLEIVQMIYDDMVDAPTAYRALISGILPARDMSGDAIDDRLRQAVELIKQDPLSNMSNQWLAQQVGLSVSQLQRLFKYHVGVPIRRYRLWHRLFITAIYMASGKSLTDAALASGFADSPHFSRTFRSMLGMTPSFVFQRHSRILINAGGDE